MHARQSKMAFAASGMGVRPVAQETDQTSGVLFIATGALYLRAAVRAATSVRQMCPGLAVAVATDLIDAPEAEAFDVVVPVEHPHRRSKVDMLSKTPFQRTIYLDTDVKVVADLSGIIEVLDRFDIAITHAHSRNKRNTTETWRVDLPDAFPQCNGGIFAFRTTPQTLQFFDDWSSAFAEAGFKKDQVTLRELLWLSDLRLYILPPEFNVRHTRYLSFWKRHEAAPKILHLARYHDMDRSYVRFLKGRLMEGLRDFASGVSVMIGALGKLLTMGSRRY